MLAGLGLIVNGLGTAIGQFFGFKRTQGNVISDAINVVSNVAMSDAQRDHAIAAIIAAEAKSGYWLSACWRPLLMLFFAGLIASWWFGYVPPNFDKPMSPMMQEIFVLIKLGIGGYIPSRTIEKVTDSIMLGKILRQFIEKKLA